MKTSHENILVVIIFFLILSLAVGNFFSMKDQAERVVKDNPCAWVDKSKC